MLFVMLMLIGTLTVPAFAAGETSGSCGENITWVYDEATMTLTISGTGEMEDMQEVPWQSYQEGIESVKIAGSVQSIGENAFLGCKNLQEVHFGGTLDQWLGLKFGGCNGDLGDAAIYCTDQSFATGNDHGTYGSSDNRAMWLFEDSGRLTIYGNGPFTDICSWPVPWQSFRDDITSVVVKDGVTALMPLCFEACANLETVELADSVQFLGEGCFMDCSSLKEIRLPNLQMYKFPNLLFSGCSSLEKVENMPSMVTTIGSSAFYGCSSLKEIEIPEDVTAIYSLAFGYCSSLKEIYLPARVNQLQCASSWDDFSKSPFAGCTGLEAIRVSEENKDFRSDEYGVLYRKESDLVSAGLYFAPASLEGSYTVEPVEYILEGAFENCTQLTEVILPDGLTSIGMDAFENCSSLRAITLPNSVNDMGSCVFQDCTSLEQVKLSTSLDWMEGWFAGCTALREFVVPDHIKHIGWQTFRDCTSLEKIVIPEGLIGIYKEAFLNCTALKEVQYEGYLGQWQQIPVEEGNECLQKIKVTAKTCSAHEEVVESAVSATCTEIGYTEYRYCGICSMVLAPKEEVPALGHAITNRMCTRCKETVDWYFTPATGTLTICFDGPMDDYDGELDGPWWDLREQVIHVVVEECVTTIGNSAFPQFAHLKTVTLPHGITSIGRLAFQLCEELESINIPDTVKTIGEAAFNGTSKLAEVYIPKSVETIGPAAFEGSLYREAYEVDPENPYYSSDLAGNLYNKEKTKLIMAPNYMKAVFIPASVTEIGDGIFALSTHMNAIYFCGTEEQWLAMKIGNRNDHMPETVYVGVSAERDCAKGNHIVVGKDGREPTCTEEGITDRKICIVCTEVTEEQKVMAKLPHTYENGVCTMCGAAEPEKPVESPFTDVQTTDWFFAPVLWAKESGVTGGKTETTFAPNESCTRAQVVTFLWAANGKPAPKTTDNPFTDVPDNAWYLQPVLWAVENGITGGTSPTTFGPDNYCTRAQVVTFLYAAAGKPDVSGKSTFEDVADTDWFAKPVIWAKENNVTGGISPTRFGPNNVCTRAQVVTFLYKVYG